MCVFKTATCFDLEYVILNFITILKSHIEEENIQVLVLKLSWGQKFNEIFSGRQLHRDVKVFRTFRELTPSTSSGCAGGLVAPKLRTHLFISFGATKR
jgi:hypothetical protein